MIEKSCPHCEDVPFSNIYVDCKSTFVLLGMIGNWYLVCNILYKLVLSIPGRSFGIRHKNARDNPFYFAKYVAKEKK